MKSFSHETRTKNLDRLASEEFDLAIVGGGITGAGVARDATGRGLNVALVEARDFAFGTSSRSSKLIHGGIRYLENMEFGLVFEALHERQLLFELAPHLVHPLRFLLPLYRDSRVGMFKMGLGMWLYDALSLFSAPELHERLDSKETLGRVPELQSQNLVGSFVYSDAYMDDDRLVIETLRSANESGAIMSNYTEVLGGQFEDHKASPRLKALECQDTITGRKFTLRARHFVGSVGPWTDRLGTKLVPDWKAWLRPSKGIHLTLDRRRLPLSQAVVMAADKDKRIVFAIPRHEMIIIGTTDTDFSKDPADVEVSSDDVRYLLKIVADYFPGARIKPQDCLASYAGVRPLVDDGSLSESATSREHKIWSHPAGITFVAGGKYTTYRHMSEEIVQECLEHFSSEDRIRWGSSKTKSPLNPLVTPELLLRAKYESQAWGQEYDVSPQLVLQLAEKYGMETEGLLKQAMLHGHHGNVWSIQAQHAIENEMCLNLIDFYTRRSRLFLAYKDHGASQVESLASTFARSMGWSDSRQRTEEASVRDFIKKDQRWRNDFSNGDTSL